MPSLDAVIEVWSSLLTLAVVGLAAWGWGSLCIRWLRLPLVDPMSRVLWGLALGLWTVSLLLLAMAALGWLYSPLLCAMTMGGVGLSAVELACAWLTHTPRRGSPRTPAPPRTDDQPGYGALTIALAACVLLVSLAAALAPPTSPTALVGELEIPKQLLWGHALDFGHATHETAVNPVHLWYAWVLAIDGPVSANLLHWALGLLLALATFVLARPLVGGISALAAGSLVLLSPGVYQQLSLPQEDLAFAWLATMALVAVCQVLVHLESVLWGVPAGLLLGTAAVIDPAGIWLAAAVGLTLGYGYWKRPDARYDLLAAGRVMSLAALTAVAPWSLAERHTAAELDGGSHATVALASSALADQSLHSTAAHLGPLLLLGLAGLFFARRLRGLNVLLGILLTYTALASVVPGAGHWWSAVLPMACIATVWTWREMVRFSTAPRLAAGFVFGLLAVVAPVACWRLAADSFAVATGQIGRRDYLLSREPTYRAASLFNRIRRPEDRLLCQDPRTFYFDGLAARPEDLDPTSRPAGQDANEAELVALARRAGFSYLLLAQQLAGEDRDLSLAPRTAGIAPEIAPAGGESADCGEVIPILEYRFADDNHRYIRYRLLRVR